MRCPLSSPSTQASGWCSLCKRVLSKPQLNTILWAAVQNMVRTVNKVVEGQKIVQSHQVLARPHAYHFTPCSCASVVSGKIRKDFCWVESRA